VFTGLLVEVVRMVLSLAAALAVATAVKFFVEQSLLRPTTWGLNLSQIFPSLLWYENPVAISIDWSIP
jgi:hypothetical protein